MALIVETQKINDLVALFYKAHSKQGEKSVTINESTVRGLTLTHGRLMLVGENFPIDFIIQPYDLKAKEDTDAFAYELAKQITSMCGADYLLGVAKEALEEDGLTVEIVGDKVIMNKLTTSIGEDDEQPTGKLSKSMYAEYPPELTDDSGE